MNEAANFVTDAYLKSKALTKISNIQHPQRESSLIKDADASSPIIERMVSA